MPLEKLIVYFAMVFCIVLEVIQMRYNANVLAWRKERWKEDTQTQIENVRAEMLEQLEVAEKAIAEDRAARRHAARGAYPTGYHREQRLRHDAHGGGGRRILQGAHGGFGASG